MKTRKRLKKGFSLMETVIAFAVIAIISVASITLLTTSIKAQEKSIRDYNVALTAENVINCFRFDTSLESLEDIYQDDFNKQTSTITQDNFSLIIIVDGNSINLTAYDLDSKQIYTLSYTK